MGAMRIDRGRQGRTWRGAALVLTIVGTIAYGAIERAQARGAAKQSTKLDRVLRQAAEAHDPKPQRVIVRVHPEAAVI